MIAQARRGSSAGPWRATDRVGRVAGQVHGQRRQSLLDQRVLELPSGRHRSSGHASCLLHRVACFAMGHLVECNTLTRCPLLLGKITECSKVPGWS